jgi:hypothetical protein
VFLLPSTSAFTPRLSFGCIDIARIAFRACPTFWTQFGRAVRIYRIRRASRLTNGGRSHPCAIRTPCSGGRPAGGDPVPRPTLSQPSSSPPAGASGRATSGMDAAGGQPSTRDATRGGADASAGHGGSGTPAAASVVRDGRRDAAAVATGDAGAAGGAVTFTQPYTTLLMPTCARCHRGNTPPCGLDYSSKASAYRTLTTVTGVVMKGSAAGSRLYWSLSVAVSSCRAALRAGRCAPGEGRAWLALRGSR